MLFLMCFPTLEIHLLSLLVSQGREEQVPFREGRGGRHDIAAVHIKEEGEVGTSSKQERRKMKGQTRVFSTLLLGIQPVGLQL